MNYTLKAEGYETKIIKAQNENAARSIFAQQAGWLSDMDGYRDFWTSILVSVK